MKTKWKWRCFLFINKSGMKSFIGVITFTMVAFFQYAAFAQVNGSIEGKVTDVNTGESLIGVTIAVEGTSYGTVTDVDGHYSLELPVGSYNITCCCNS